MYSPVTKSIPSNFILDYTNPAEINVQGVAESAKQFNQNPAANLQCRSDLHGPAIFRSHTVAARTQTRIIS